jgi:hypothetical protein
MSGILTPGYLRWDGTKYVLDHDIEIIGPPGAAGPAGPLGPVGPPGPTGTATGDLNGNYPGPMQVVGLTGLSGVVAFGAGIVNPTITQTTLGGTNGQPLTLRAQNAGLFGGNLVLQSGTGSTAGIIQFIIGSTQAAFIDSNFAYRTGPGANSTSSGPNGTAPIAGQDFFYGNSLTGSMWMELFSNAANQRAGVGVYNTAAGGTSNNGISIQAPGSTFAFGAYQLNGVIEQTGAANTALVLGKNQGDGSGRAISGRIWQSGAWAIGDGSNNNTSVNAQAGLVGTLINLTGIGGGGGLTSQSGQVTIFNSLVPPNFNTPGILNLQAHNGTNFITNTTVMANISATKFITNQGRTVKLRTTTTSPFTVLTTDEIISIGAITANTTTIGITSNGVSLPTGTINVASTAGFATSGTLLVTTGSGAQIVTYTGTSLGTQFTGCSGGVGVMATGGPVVSLFTVTLPSLPATGDTYTVKDANGSAAAANILVLGNGANIDGQSSVLMMTNYTQAVFIFNGTTWISSLGNNLIPNGFSSVIQVASGGIGNVVGFDQLILCDPTSGSCTVNAPFSPIANLRFTVKDQTAQARVLAPIIVFGSGRLLEDPGNPGVYIPVVNLVAASRSVTWAYDPFKNRYMVV